MSVLVERQTVYFNEEEHSAFMLAYSQLLLDAVTAKLENEGEDTSFVTSMDPEKLGIFRRKDDPGVYVIVEEEWPEGMHPATPYVAPVTEPPADVEGG